MPKNSKNTNIETTTTSGTARVYTLGSSVPAKLHRQYRFASMAYETTVSALVESALASHAEERGFVDPLDFSGAKQVS